MSGPDICVYGVATDGITYVFLRLDHDLRLQVSKPYDTSFEEERTEVSVVVIKLIAVRLFADCLIRY
jgi:hypothetical protein